MTVFQTTQLDFDTIKSSLIKHFTESNEFSDYNFEASALSSLLDVLAYNTHYNALTANFSLNETFLNSAQLRPSVVSIANYLGYNIRSVATAKAELNISLNLSEIPSDRRLPITLPKGTTFVANSENVNYTFSLLENYTARSNDQGIYIFSKDSNENIPVYEGRLITKTFLVGEDFSNQSFVIPDKNIDTKTVEVKVFDTYNSSSFKNYDNIFNAREYNVDSRYYRIIETPTGEYELGFGDGITTGQRPINGNKVELTYMSSSGSASNNLSSFFPTNPVRVLGTDYNLVVDSVSPSFGGQEKQSIDSIKFNAPLSFASQQRLVTTEDYETSILTNFTTVTDAVAWGGEDNIPSDYGSVYISLIFATGIDEATMDREKLDIENSLNDNLGVLSISVKFVEPIITYMEFISEFGIREVSTANSTASFDETVRATIISYVAELKSFKSSYRKSYLTSLIDDNQSILYSNVDVKLQQRLTPIGNKILTTAHSLASNYTLEFPVRIKDPSTPLVVKSTNFDYNQKRCYIRNTLNNTNLEIVDLDDNIVRDSVGNYIPFSGIVNFVAFDPGKIASDESFIKISVIPENENIITPTRNHYLDIDTDTLSSNAIIEK